MTKCLLQCRKGQGQEWRIQTQQKQTIQLQQTMHQQQQTPLTQQKSLPTEHLVSFSTFFCISYRIIIILKHFLSSPVENSYHCGKEVLYITKSRNNYTHTNGIRYNCIIKNPLKQTTCTEFCEYNSRPITCEVMNHTDKRKKYICSAIEDGQDLSGISQSQHTFEQRFDEVVTSSCHCFYL